MADDLVTPCHGVAPIVDLMWFNDEQFPSGFYCPATGCNNDWDKNGKAATYNK